MDYWVYVLESEKNHRYYIGFSRDPKRRLDDHNAGKVKGTRYARPWKLAYVEKCAEATLARKREHRLKAMKSRVYLETLISSGAVVRAPR